MSHAPITFFNRHTGLMETEAIYGEASLRWIYNSPLGKAALHTLVKRAVFSKFYGWLMSRPQSAEKVAPFIAKYGLDVEEFAERADSYRSFNEFFSRKLKPDARPVDADPASVVFPADGRHLLVPNASACTDLFVKGARFDLESMVGDAELARRFANGSALISRLCPTDYHRFHFPCAGTPSAPQLLNGPLYSVSPIALMQRPTILWENKRYLTRLTDTPGGQVLYFEIGATCVGAVVHTSQPHVPVKKGDEKGTFLFGGSSTMVLFEAGAVDWAPDLIKHSAAGQELYVRMGGVAGQWARRAH